MSLSAEQLATIKAALGDAGAEAFTGIADAVTASKAALDAAKGEATKASRAGTASAKALALAQADLETAKSGDSERLAALTAERDAAKAATDAAVAGHRSYRIGVKLGEAMGISDAGMRADALALFKLPEGADIGEDGTLTGVDEALRAFKEGKPYLFEAPTKAPGNGGPRRGTTAPGTSGAGGKETREGTISRWTTILGLKSAKSATGA